MSHLKENQLKRGYGGAGTQQVASGTHQDGDPGGQLLPFGFGTLEALGGLLISVVGHGADQSANPAQGAGSTGSAGSTGLPLGGLWC